MSQEQLFKLINFIGTVFGDRTQLTLYDIRSSEPKIIALQNGHLSGDEMGQSITTEDLSVLRFLDAQEMDRKINFTSNDSNGKPFQSSCLLLHDEKNQPQYMLCIHRDFSQIRKVIHILEGMANGSNENLTHQEAPENQNISEEQPFAHFPDSISEMIQGMVRKQVHQATLQSGVDADRLKTNEKIHIVEHLYHKGLFAYRETLQEVSGQLNISQATIYRYLAKIQKEEEFERL